MATLFPDNNFVPAKLGDGKRLVVGEAPGEDESIKLEPFVGGSGRFLDSLYSKAGVRRSELSFINTIQCRPPENKFPTDPTARDYNSALDGAAAVEHCVRNHVRPLIAAGAWQRIDLIGAKALQHVAGDRRGITAARGDLISIVGADGVAIPAVPTIHPAALMRSQELIPAVISDLKKSTIQPPEDYLTHPSPEEVRAFTATTFAADIENNRWTGEIYEVGLCAEPFKAIVVPFSGPYIAELRRIFLGARELVTQNGLQHDQPLLRKNGIAFQDDLVQWDIMLMHALVQPSLPHDLEFISSIFLSKPFWKHKESEDRQLYCARDTDVTFQIWLQLKALLRQFQLEGLYHNVSVPMALICHEMHEVGIRLDPSRVKEVRERLIAQQADEEAFLPSHLRTQQVPVRRRLPAPAGAKGKSGRPIKFQLVESSKQVVPWRSDKAVGHWLYDDLKLPVQTHLETGEQTTNKVALEKLHRLSGNRGILAIRTLRSIDETLTTFAKEKMTVGKEIHAYFNVHGTSSGRLSSSEPNMQNIPEAARVIYVPRHSDWRIVQADYSQIENRLTAHFAGDGERLARFAQAGFSEHKYAASIFFAIPYAEVVKDNDKEAPYGKAKRIVHGSNYGMGARKISLLYDIPEREVKDLQSKWKAAIPKTTLWQEITAKQAYKEGQLRNPFGRLNWFYTKSYYTESLSFLPQSTGADIILRAMIGLMYERIGWPLERAMAVSPVCKPLPKPANLLVSVHDSLVFECAAGQVDELVETITAVMTQPWRELGGFSCPISVEVGDSWGTLEAYNGKS